MEDFLRLPANFYRSLGVDPFATNRNTSIALHLVFVAQLVGLSLAMYMQMELVWINEDFFQSMQVLGYSTFGIAGILKVITVQLRKDKMISMVGQLRSCFPSPTEEEQKQYEVKVYLRRFHRFAKAFGGLFLALVITYDIAAIGQYAFQRWVLRLPNPTQTLPYVSPLPWEWRDSWRYYPTYLMQSINGYSATGYHISADIMIFAVVMQVIMHFDRLAKALREFKFCRNAKEDFKNLRALIEYHNQVLDLTDVMNEIFGIPLLLNFLASSLLVCNVGFQLTLGFSLEHIGQQLMLLTSALVEIYLICFFSQMLIDAVCRVIFFIISTKITSYFQSEHVSFAVYEMNWLEADIRFRKMLVLLCLRAQKPVCLKATVFVDISIGTMSIFLRVSYKFFCAIRSMYQ
ncbi:hypothetical protein KR200_002608 [Drosophila serrata]|nr:hypothetical protein KR200_002608 [Drosophila serrata]